MMLPTDKLDAVHVEHMQPGQMGWYSAPAGGLFIVGQYRDKKVSIDLSADKNQFGGYDAMETASVAVRIDAIAFQIDPTSAIRTAQVTPLPGHLVVDGQGISLPFSFGTQERLLNAQIVSNQEPDSRVIGMAYERWSIVTMVGDKEVELFKKD